MTKFPSRLRKETSELGGTLLYLAIALFIAAVIAVIIVRCSSQKGVPGTSSADVTNELKPLVQSILGLEISKQQAQDAADKIAREVISANLAAGRSKEELRKWCQEVQKQLNEHKQGLPNDQKIKFQAAIDAVKKVCDELLGP
jgi:hypothetical protein